jgi:cardiolipin synthase A/B
MIDGIGCLNSSTILHKECAKRNIHFKIYHPIFKTLRLINRRNHRKVIIIDKRIVFLGSFNISRVHSARYTLQNNWRDTGLSVTFSQVSKEIEVLIKSFWVLWENHKLFFKNFSSSIFRLNANPYLRFKMFRDINQRIKNAKTKINITNPYFLPRRNLLRNLRKAASHRVNVTLLLPAVSDVWVVKEASKFLYERILSSGIRIFELQNRTLHAKTILIDNWASIGSTNLDHRSLIHDLEIEAVISNPVIIDELSKQWDDDIKNSKEIILQDFNKRGIISRIAGRFFYWFRYWL